MARTTPTLAPDRPAPGRDLIARRHPEWQEFSARWRWLLDSYEGGERYRQAIYGYDHRGLPVRNLVRHKREYPDPRDAATANFQGVAPAFGVGQDPSVPATDDDYELRRARTPVPTFVKEYIGDHLDRVFAREVKRTGPRALEAWWRDVDGRRTPIDRWLAESAAPDLLACGQLDVLFDHPPAPAGPGPRSRAEAAAMGTDRCVASIVLPENLLWWRLDAAGRRYVECLVREYPGGDDALGLEQGAPGGDDALGLERGAPGVTVAAPPIPAPAQPPDTARYRHWRVDGSTLYDARGNVLADHPHDFGRVPIVRVFSRRKTRCTNVGQSDYEGVAERQREYYNRDSELILSDTLQAHPLLQGPEDFIQADGTIPMGPSWLLPKKKNSSGTSTTYEGFDVVDFPKDGAESIRLNKADIRDDVDRDMAACKPAGASGGSVVSQSGLSKSFDNAKLNNKLCRISDTLAAAERTFAEFALAVLGDGEPDPADVDAVEVEYSRQFELTEVEDTGAFIARILEIAAAPAAALLPTITAEHLKSMVRESLTGREDSTYAGWDAEVDAAIARGVAALPPAGPPVPAPPLLMPAASAPTQATVPTQTPPGPAAATDPPSAAVGK